MLKHKVKKSPTPIYYQEEVQMKSITVIRIIFRINVWIFHFYELFIYKVLTKFTENLLTHE